MGRRYIVTCRSCGNVFRFDQGSLMWDYEEGQKEMMEKALRGELGIDFKKKAARNKQGWIHRSDELFYCEKCNEYSNESYYKMYSKPKWWKKRRVVYRSKHFCKKCEGEIFFIDGKNEFFESKQIVCPVCRGNTQVGVEFFFD